jgi:SAM-dependent methyltransferase
MSRQFPDAEVLGIDFQKESVEACLHVKNKIRLQNVNFKKSSIENLSERNYFDLIICVDILEHIEDDLAALESLFSATLPGGILLLHVPSLYRRYPVWKKRINFDVPTHLRPGYLPEDIIFKVNEAGFTIRDWGFTYGFLETLANNISYMITRARKDNKILYSIAFPALNLMSMIGARARPKRLGAGIFVVAEKDINK